MADKVFTAMDFYKLPGVRDLTPMKARGNFAKALATEANAGHTTPEAEAQLNLAVKIEELSIKAAGL